MTVKQLHEILTDLIGAECGEYSITTEGCDCVGWCDSVDMDPHEKEVYLRRDKRGQYK